ncbi:MAG: 2-oxoacid:acceptor oxidoreductase family protein [Desulfomicrobium sp.]|nr:2-oxoacid:acceptor oxidoreductase family protein [Desulfomicrobium sp.]
MNAVKALCVEKNGHGVVMQGNMAFAVGCVRGGIHAADGYPGTPSTEVIDKGLSQVQDMITVGWSVNEAVAVGVGFGHTLAGSDCVVTMKIPGLFQAADIITSSAFYTAERGSLIYYIASDYTPNSTQHLVDPRYMLQSCCLPVFEPRNHQEMHEAARIAADLGRRFHCPVVIIASGVLCHSEGLVRLMETSTRDKAPLPEKMSDFITLPLRARMFHDQVRSKRIPALREMVEQSPLNNWIKGDGRIGVITHGVNTLFLDEVRVTSGQMIDVLSLGFTYPLPMNLIERFCTSVDGPVYVIEDGYRFIQDALLAQGLKVEGKGVDETITEWTPALITQRLGLDLEIRKHDVTSLPRPPMICAGCPYRLFGQIVGKMRKKGKLEAVFGDIGCNTLLHFLNAMDTALAMGASEAKRLGYVLSRPEAASKCLAVLGDGTECHSGMDATRNTIFRHIPGVKVILNNSWTAMTGGQPSPTSPANLAGDPNVFDLNASLKAHGAHVVEVNGYDKKALEKALKAALEKAEQGIFTTLVVTGVCIRKMPKEAYGLKMEVDADLCKRCGLCLICSGIEADSEGLPFFNNICSGCVRQNAACAQMCPVGAIAPAKDQSACGLTSCPELPTPPETVTLPETSSLPPFLSVAVRGVGGQGNLFFGRVLTQLAYLLGYDQKNIVKGETHGMAQMGGPVISTFACGQVHSPVPMPGTCQCLVCMERSEVFRPGFLDMLRPGGTIILADTAIMPPFFKAENYPSVEAVHQALGEYKVIDVDVLNTALALGDATGRSANVVMIGVLSTIAPFDSFPQEYWLQALKNVSPKPAIWQANYAAFLAGRKLGGQ